MTTTLGKYLEQYTYPNLMKQALERVPDNVDKTEGSIIFDALSPACYELADFYLDLRRFLDDTYILTSTGEELELRCAEQGIERYPATKALKKADFAYDDNTPFVVPLGSRFSTISKTESYIYAVKRPYVDGQGAVVAGSYVLECETPGIVGNEYIGSIIPVSYIQGLAKANMGDYVEPARDKETDDALRLRYLQKVNNKPFGGNIAQYDQEVKAIDGVGELQVYPAWEGGGTVKLSVIDPSFEPLTEDFLMDLQKIIDPEVNEIGGQGLGMAPIAHLVTVDTATILYINVTCDITLASGFTEGQVEAAIESAIGEYLLELRKVWGIPDSNNEYHMIVYIAQVTSAIIQVPGVANVTNVLLNGVAQDLVLTENATVQQLPMRGTVTINAT